MTALPSCPPSIVGTTDTARHVGTGTAAGKAPALARPMTALPAVSFPASIVGTTGGNDDPLAGIGTGDTSAR